MRNIAKISLNCFTFLSVDFFPALTATARPPAIGSGKAIHILLCCEGFAVYMKNVVLHTQLVRILWGTVTLRVSGGIPLCLAMDWSHVSTVLAR